MACDLVALATRYRVRMMIEGVESDYRLVGSSSAPLVSISGIAPGQTVQIIVQAVNGSLQGVASDPIEFTVSLPATKAAAEAKPVLVIEPASNGHANGNGHRNGNGAHARGALI